MEESEERLTIDIHGSKLAQISDASYEAEKNQELKGNCYKNQETFEENQRRKSKNHDFQCFFCGKMFSKINIKKYHIKNEHAMELFCRVCNSKKPSSTATENCLKDHKFGFDYLCQVRFFNFLRNFYKIKTFCSATDLRKTISS